MIIPRTIVTPQTNNVFNTGVKNPFLKIVIYDSKVKGAGMKAFQLKGITYRKTSWRGRNEEDIPHSRGIMVNVSHVNTKICQIVTLANLVLYFPKMDLLITLFL